MEEKMTGEQRIALWQQRLDRFTASGMTKRAWCMQNGIAESTLRYWTRKLRHEQVGQRTWMQLSDKESAAVQGGDLTITCPGAEIIITSEADPELRSRLIKAMVEL